MKQFSHIARELKNIAVELRKLSSVREDVANLRKLLRQESFLDDAPIDSVEEDGFGPVPFPPCPNEFIDEQELFAAPKDCGFSLPSS